MEYLRRLSNQLSALEEGSAEYEALYDQLWEEARVYCAESGLSCELDFDFEQFMEELTC